MAALEAELTSGYCHRCHGYGRGEYAETLSLWSDAITNHVGCPESAKPDTPPVGGQHKVGGLHGMPGLIVAGALD